MARTGTTAAEGTHKQMLNMFDQSNERQMHKIQVQLFHLKDYKMNSYLL